MPHAVMVSSKDYIQGAVSFNLTTYLQSCSKYISLVSAGAYEPPCTRRKEPCTHKLGKQGALNFDR